MDEIKRIVGGVQSFAEDMRRQNIHVGLGSQPHCVTCGEPWPCRASTTPENVECPHCNGVGSIYPAPYRPGMEGDPCDDCVEGRIPAPPPENVEEQTHG